MMLEIFLGLVLFSIGFACGSWFKAVIYDNQPWEAFRWDSQTLAYRPIPIGAMLGRHDKVIIGLRLDTQQIPEDGLKYEYDDKNR